MFKLTRHQNQSVDAFFAPYSVLALLGMRATGRLQPHLIRFRPEAAVLAPEG